MKKIVFVIGSLGIGGAERVISLLANYFVNNGYIVTIILFYQGDRIDYNLDVKVNVKSIKIENGQNKIFRIISRCKELKKILVSEKADVVISFLTEINIYTIMAMFGSESPLIISERNDPANDPPQKSLRLLRRMMYKYANGIVFQTEDAKKYFKKLKINSDVIPNPISDSIPEPCDNVKRTNRIVTVCRLTEQKNLKMLIDAYEQSEDSIKEKYTVEIYGEGPQKEDLEKMIHEKNLDKKVYLKGFSKTVHDNIRDARLFVLTSNYEGISNSMLEALALGLPVICTDCPVGGARLAIEDGHNGVLVEVGNTRQLVDRMRKVLTDEEFSCSISSHSDDIRRKFSVDAIIQKWKDFVEEIISNE